MRAESISKQVPKAEERYTERRADRIEEVEMAPMFTFQDIDLICFDVFGTLIEISERRRPFAHLGSGCIDFRRTA